MVKHRLEEEERRNFKNLKQKRVETEYYTIQIEEEEDMKAILSMFKQRTQPINNKRGM